MTNVFDLYDPLIQYKPSDIDESGDPKYYGFLDRGGNWYIMQITSGTTIRYVKGSTGYAAAWTGRAGQTYNYFNIIFV